MNYLQLPVEVLRRSAGMSLSQVAIWADAWTWAQNDRKAYRTNAQIAEMLNITERSASRAIKELASIGAIEVRMLNGRQRLITAIHPDKWQTPDVDVHRRARPSTQTSTDVNVYPAQTPTSTHPRRERLPTPDVDVHQEENREENRIEKRIEKNERAKKIEIVMPWPSDEFAQAWADWKEYKRAEKGFRFKTVKSEQIALHKLYNDAEQDQHLAIYAIGTSIANGWAGLFVNAQLKREFSGLQKRAGIDTFADELADYIRNNPL